MFSLKLVSLVFVFWYILSFRSPNNSLSGCPDNCRAKPAHPDLVNLDNMCYGCMARHDILYEGIFCRNCRLLIYGTKPFCFTLIYCPNRDVSYFRNAATNYCCWWIFNLSNYTSIKQVSTFSSLNIIYRLLTKKQGKTWNSKKGERKNIFNQFILLQ